MCRSIDYDMDYYWHKLVWLNTGLNRYQNFEI